MLKIEKPHHGIRQAPACSLQTAFGSVLARRPSCLDLITLLRKEMAEHPELLTPYGLPSYERFSSAAAA
jgi:hypothetical protein